MKEITLRIPEKKFNFFMELVNQLGLEVTNDNLEIPEWHKEIVLDRIKNAKDEDFFSLDDLDNKIKL